MKWMNINKKWKFTYKGQDALYLKENPMHVDLPHDFSITTKMTEDALSGFAGGYYQGGAGVYEKTILVKDTEESVFLVLEGAYMITEVFINGNLASFHPNGYTENRTDLTSWIQEGENQLKIIVSNEAMPNSRWYSGSGIYRDVWLVTGTSTGLFPQDISVETVSADVKEAVLRVKTRISRGTDMQGRLQTQIFDGNGNAKVQMETDLQGVNLIKQEACQKGVITQDICISNPALWDTQQPNLYRIRQTIVTADGKEDECEITFGIRTISFDCQRGFCLNGVPMKLKGGCLHHDNGLLGSCVYVDAEYRKIKKLKELGYNAVRTAHNPASRTFLDVCDRLGMLVMEEMYDNWGIKKNTHDYHLFFRDWWKRDIQNVVERDRNHPSIIMWSTGNEIVERDGNSNGYEWAQLLAEEIRNYDNTRAVTNGICAVFMENGEFGGLLGNIFNGSAGDIEEIEVDYPGVRDEYQKAMDTFEQKTEKFAAPLDVVGYNYLERYYERGHSLYPQRIICGTESYPRGMEENWAMVERLPYVIGDFTWTAWDYLGESGIGRAVYGCEKLPGLFGEYPWHISGCGDVDICGYVKAQGEYRKRMWTNDKNPFLFVEKPENHGAKEILSPWGWEEGTECWDFPEYEGIELKVTVYGVTEEIALILNGEEVGRERKTPGIGKVTFHVKYHPGILEAVSFENDVEVGRTSAETTKATTKILCEQEQFGSSEELIYLKLLAADENGNRKYACQSEIQAEIEGAGSLLALGNADMKGTEDYQTGKSRFYEGRALLILRRSGEGSIRVKIYGRGLEPVMHEF